MSDQRIIKCNACGHRWRDGPDPRVSGCPNCRGTGPFATTNILASGLKPTGTLAKGVDRVLSAQRLTVLGVLLGIGMTVGLSLGFGIGGGVGIGVGTGGGIAVPGLLAVAFRHRTTRRWLASLADWAIARR